MTRNRKIIILIIAVIVVLFGWLLIRGPEDTWICENGQWVKHGNPSSSMPTEPCDKEENIIVYSPQPNQTIASPLLIEGKARGNWFFEADFPVKLFDGSGNLMATAIAQAQGEWMTEDFVPFKAELYFEPVVTETGTLVLEEDNPSGLPENADELRIPVKFKIKL